MNLNFERVLATDKDKILAIYNILRKCGEEMYKRFDLKHWRTPYAKEAIEANCTEREVFLAKDLDINQYVHTFQLEFILSNSLDNILSVMESYKPNTIAEINKFATSPEYSGRGIGRKSLGFIEGYCRDKKIKLLSLDVYDKSENAIRFYENCGFEIIGTKPTRHFQVYIMQKRL